jgi:hypothetical protein
MLYKEFSESNIEYLIDRIESTSEYPIATLIHALYSDRFVSIAAKSDYIWYEFGKHRWERNNGFHLKGIMNTELHTLFNNKIVYHKKEVQRLTIEIIHEKKKNLDDDSLLEELGQCLTTHTEKAKLYKTICDSLHKNNYKNGLLNECGLLFQRPESDKFVERLDEQKHLIGFNNGVFDLGEFVFRDGLPDDMLTFTTGYDYTDQVNQTTRDSILTFKHNIMSNEDMTTYLLNTEAYALHGDKYLQHIHISNTFLSRLGLARTARASIRFSTNVHLVSTFMHLTLGCLQTSVQQRVVLIRNLLNQKENACFSGQSRKLMNDYKRHVLKR